MDETMLAQAAEVLHQQLGGQWAGELIGGQVQMRRALMDGLRLDEAAADRAVKGLMHSGLVRFQPDAPVEPRHIGLLDPQPQTRTGVPDMSSEGSAPGQEANASNTGADSQSGGGDLSEVTTRVATPPLVAAAALNNSGTAGLAQAGVLDATLAGGGANPGGNAGVAAATGFGADARERREPGDDAAEAGDSRADSYAADTTPANAHGTWLIRAAQS